MNLLHATLLRLLQVASRASVLGNLAKFDFSWFIPAVVKYRKLLAEVFAVSLFIQIFALVTPCSTKS